MSDSKQEQKGTMETGGPECTCANDSGVTDAQRRASCANQARDRGELCETQGHDVEAYKWYRQAAMHGDARAQLKLAVAYELGQHGLSQDDHEAVVWYRKAADQGEADAQYNVGAYYQRGKGGLREDMQEAMEWFHKAAGQGHNTAQAIERELSSAPWRGELA